MRNRSRFHQPPTHFDRPERVRSCPRRRFMPDAESLERHLCLSHAGGLVLPIVPAPHAEITLPISVAAGCAPNSGQLWAPARNRGFFGRRRANNSAPDGLK